jgi:NAD-dependent dihydropyrimidine dehydrogenase PreA subunit
MEEKYSDQRSEQRMGHGGAHEETGNKRVEKMMAECKYRFVVDESKCTGCLTCVESCPNEVLESKDGRPYAVRQAECEGCEVCVAVCEQEAVVIAEDSDCQANDTKGES